jgi:hypothetical protein
MIHYRMISIRRSPRPTPSKWRVAMASCHGASNSHIFPHHMEIRPRNLPFGGEVGTVRKMGLKLCSIERMLKMQFSMAHKFTLQSLRRYDVKPPKKPYKPNLPFDMPCLEKTKQHRWGLIQRSQDHQTGTLPLRHTSTCKIDNN